MAGLRRVSDRGSEIDFLYARVRPNLGGRPFGDLAAEIENDDLIAQRANEMHVVLDYEQRDRAVAANPLEQTL
jgi:hypothetical protein